MNVFIILKQGYRLEELQFEEPERLDKAIATCTIVSWRIIYLAYLSRVSPDLPCTKEFEKTEWQALYCYVHKTS